MVIVLLRARLAVSGMQMKRGMGIAADESKRQQHDEAAQEQESLHEMSTDSGGFEPLRIPDSTRLLEGEGGPHDLLPASLPPHNNGEGQAWDDHPLQQRREAGAE